MVFRFQYKAYRRPFKAGFANARSAFSHREGVIVRVEDADGRFGFGEAAPLVDFGTESLATVLGNYAQLEESLEWGTVGEGLRRFRASFWGIESAIAALARCGEDDCLPLERPWPVAALVSDLGALDEMDGFLRQHYRCFKYKIGKSTFLEERRSLDRVFECMEAGQLVRLDANASLSLAQARQWLESLEGAPVEFLEQPLGVGQESEMIRLASDSPIELALDESVCSLDDFKRWRDAQWPGVFVIKPSISGDWGGLLEELGQGEADCVYSSSLETVFGSANALWLASRFPARQRALGFGVGEHFAERNFGLELGPFLQSESAPLSSELDSLWNQI